MSHDCTLLHMYCCCMILYSKGVNRLRSANQMQRAGTYIPVLLLFLFVYVLQSCHSGSSGNENFMKQYRNLLQLAERFSNTIPDSSLLYSDSLLHNPKVLAEDSLLIPVLMNKALALRVAGLQDSCLKVLAQLPGLCKRSGDTASWSRTENIKAAVFSDIGQTQLVIKHAGIAYGLAQQAGLKLHAARAALKIGGAYMENNELLKSQLHFQRAFAIFVALDSLAHTSEVASQIAVNYKTLGKLDSALWYGRLAVRKAEAYQQARVRGQAYNNMGLLVQGLQPDSALHWYNKSRALQPAGLHVRMNIISLAIQTGDYGMAEKMLDSLMKDCEVQGSWPGIARCHQQYARIYEEKGEWKMAARELERAVHIGDSVGIGFVSMAARESLQQVHRQSGRTEAALQLGDYLTRLKDSFDRDEKIQAMQVLRKYQESEKLQETLYRQQVEIGAQTSANRQQKRVIVLLLIALTLLTFIIVKARSYFRERGLAYDRMLQHYREEAARLQTQLDNAAPMSLIEKLVQYLEHEKPWRDPDLKVDDLAARIGSNRKAIAAELKKENIPGLTHLVQRYRVEAAIRMMQDPKFKHYKLQAISTDCGFGSYRTFQYVFEQITGLSPVQFRQRLDEH